jgi:hypothetical protein
VAAWADQSGNARDLAESTNKPLWQASQVNGMPAILFDGVNDKLLSAGIALPQPFTMLLLYQEVVHTNGNIIFSTANVGGGNAPEIYMDTVNTAIVKSGTVGAAVHVGTGGFALVTGIANGTSSTIALNDGSPQTNPADINGAGDILALGCRGDATSFANINVAELVLLGGSVSAPDKAALLEYFRTLYGLW